MTIPRLTVRPLFHACGFATLLLVLSGCSDRASTTAATPVQSDPTDMTYVFAIEGMHCDGCVMSITQGVKELEGVRDVQVSLEEERATVRVAKEGPTPEAVVAAIDQRGYDATLAPSESPSGQ